MKVHDQSRAQLLAQLRTQRRERCAELRRGPMAEFVLRQEERRDTRQTEQQAQNAHPQQQIDLDRLLEQYDTEREYDADSEEEADEQPEGRDIALERELELMLALEQQELEELTRNLNLDDERKK
ncbi:hypothetical protein KL921_004439 [Ogataea angusta]|uniref:Uncharacterized protein n=1 Tax=Pichia angusta TaxID=870730 RepID=A0AAN6I4C9_PICAN|nr:uncharacterized protein KL928_004793 [Ogataea angusta]KAG7807015.1 hypothetical protein KL921_004439 [Ogataea angusta]KAG7816237.1 hypothetical protein KL928_004793 [Ogataea angusta]KAG7822492.1 hypothetical protein KL909_004180 [Ogataea angusta]KAG7832689.1 hypothetical protein KL943_004630 [Ogataea angusta]KAG7837508.1 hypothetical protein KL942_004396 [Ogataea angusta]